jgi:plasmid stability protein
VSDITIRDLDDRLTQRLEARAAGHGRTIEAEAHDILRTALQEGATPSRDGNLYDAIRKIVEPLGGMELSIPPRKPVRESPRFD